MVGPQTIWLIYCRPNITLHKDYYYYHYYYYYYYYRAMHFSAKRGIAIACRLSVRLSVCLSVCGVGEL